MTFLLAGDIMWEGHMNTERPGQLSLCVSPAWSFPPSLILDFIYAQCLVVSDLFPPPTRGGLHDGG